MSPHLVYSFPLRNVRLWIALVGGLALVGSVVVARNDRFWGPQVIELGPNDIETVRRVPLEVSVNAPGVIESAANTRVECEIERLQLRVQGRSLTSSGSTRILKLVPDGSFVKKGDVICTLDSSEFEEMLRTQTINVERAKAERLQAEMDLDVAKIALEEYRKGTAQQQVQTLKGQIALAQTDSTRLTSRLEWARKMYQKGYMSRNMIRSEETQMQRSDISLSNAELALKTFQKFTQPKMEHQFRTRIIALERELASEINAERRFIERLDKYEEMVEKCVIRAPHDGMVVYAHNPDRNFMVEEGADVRQGQTIFYLPDLSRMQVMARLSESIVKQVEKGMPVRIEVESTTGRSYRGYVERIAQFPMPPSSWRASQDIKNYYCVVRITDTDDSLRPGLNAEIEVLTDRVEDSMVLSPDAVKLEGNQEFCFVRLPDGQFEKREIRTRTGDPSSLVVLDGLNDGEQVLRTLKIIETQPDAVVNVALLENDATSPGDRSDLADRSTSDESIVLSQSPQAEFDPALPASTQGY